MKKMYLLLALPLLFTACKPKDNTDATAAKTDSASYAYTIKKPDNWVINTDNANIRTALKALKAFELSDTAMMRSCFADTVILNADGTFKAPLTQFLRMSKSMRDSVAKFTIVVEDWESVLSRDKTEEWVSTWYKDITTDKSGKTDSVSVVNDMKFANGKIARMDIYSRKLK